MSSSKIKQILTRNGFDPDAPANVSNSAELKDFTEKNMPSLLKKAGKDIDIVLEEYLPVEGGEAYGKTKVNRNTPNKSLRAYKIEISKIALESNLTLFSTVGHELNHAYHYNSGLFAKWQYRFGFDKAFAMSEYASQLWEQKLGGIPTVEIMKFNMNIIKCK